MLRSFVIYWFPFLGYAALIYWGSDSPVNVSIPFFEEFHIDKIIHALEFFIFAVLFIRVYPSVKNRMSYHEHIYAAVILTMIYGLSDELHQAFVPGREISVWDWTADSLGGISAGILSYVFHEAGSI